MSKFFFSTILGFLAVLVMTSSSYSKDTRPRIARWFDNKEAAVSLRFDDNLESHVRVVIPLLNMYGIKATFMVNPGKASFKRYQDFWNVKVPAMGHILGNHTMHHQGARNLQEAKFEIGEAARIIRKLYPDRSPLMVFASGGGEKWGGNEWKVADKEFKELVEKNNLIDLYDGKFTSFGAHSDVSIKDFIIKLEDSLNQGNHQPFSFHQIGSPGFKNRFRSFLGGYDWSLPENQFNEFIEYLDSRSNQLWIAPLVDVLKYERERDQARLTNYSMDKSTVMFNLEISKDPRIYDQLLTIILTNPGWVNFNVTQDNRKIHFDIDEGNFLLINAQPHTSRIVLREDKT